MMKKLSKPILEDLRKQIKETGSGLVKCDTKDQAEKLFHWLENKLPKKSCLITFDDGLKESYENGLPILDDMGIPAAFFIIRRSYASE